MRSALHSSIYILKKKGCDTFMGLPLILSCVRVLGFAPALLSHYRAYTIVYFSAGEFTVCFEGKTFTTSGNSLLFVNHLDNISVEPLSQICEQLIVQFSFDPIGRLTSCPQLLTVFRNRPAGFVPCFEAAMHTAEIFDTFFCEYNSPDNFSDEVISGGLTMLLVELFRRKGELFPLPHLRIKPQVEAVRLDIETNFYKGLIVADIAAKFDLSLYYLSHTLKALTGHSPKQFILINQLSLAKELLLTTNLSISEISTQCGFLDSSSFARSFSQQIHTTPREYRKLK